VGNRKIPWWNPAAFAAKRPFLEKRARVLRALRGYFDTQGFLEVSTPALQISPGLEPHLNAFRTELLDPSHKESQTRYLHTSPEFSMKKLLSAGLEKIYQVGPVYRNRERSHTHHPEFHMLEWYRKGASYTELMDDCERLLQACALSAGVNSSLNWRQVKADPFQRFERLTVQEAFQRYAQTDILSTIEDAHEPQAKALLEQCRKLGLHHSANDSWEDLFFRIFLEKIEPNLGVGVPTILYDYPVSMAALSRPKPGAEHLAERFELYVCGLELANAFGELTNPQTQRLRFEADMEKKQQLYGERYPIDEDFLAALEIFPESSGIALGFDRLVMLITGADHIETVLWAPVAGPEN
jgi:lysyl-tRNA synthetase class 2